MVVGSNGGITRGCCISHGRYDLKEDQQLEMDQYIAKEREEAVKKARERRRAEIMVRLLVSSQSFSRLLRCFFIFVFK